MITTRKLERQRRKYKITPPRKGDVFTIPLDDGRVHLGQVIAFERFDLLFYIVVFDLVTTPERAPGLVDRALASCPILAGQTMDALFKAGGLEGRGQSSFRRGPLPARLQEGHAPGNLRQGLPDHPPAPRHARGGRASARPSAPPRP